MPNVHPLIDVALFTALSAVSVVAGLDAGHRTRAGDHCICTYDPGVVEESSCPPADCFERRDREACLRVELADQDDAYLTGAEVGHRPIPYRR